MTYSKRAFYLLVALSAMVTLSKASPLDDFYKANVADDEDEGEGRIFFSSNGGISLTNSTIDFNALLTLLLLGILFAVTIGPSFFGTQSGG